MKSRVSLLLLTGVIATLLSGIASSQQSRLPSGSSLLLPVVPDGKYAFLARPIGSSDSEAISNALPFSKIELQRWGPPDLFELKPGHDSQIILTNDGLVFYNAVHDAKRNGKFKGAVSLADFGRLCLLLDRLGAQDEKCELGVEVHGSNPVVAQLTVFAKGGSKPRVYRNDKNFGDYRFWLVQSVIERLIADVDWVAVNDP